MTSSLSPNTQAILLLTAPLIAGRGEPSADLLTQSQYRKLARHLWERQRQPSDLLADRDDDLLEACEPVVDVTRLKRLLSRGFLLSQAIERWQARAIWVVSRADADYPRRLKARLKEDAPPILYGCGEKSIFETGGLAVVGSRHVDDKLVVYTEDIGRLAARAKKTLVSGGARGIDQAAMRGALQAGGLVGGVMADSLEKTVMKREHRNMLMDGQLALISPYDPSAGFNVGHAMQRNKLIYALADAALVVSSDYQKGGTWSGAAEQLDKLRFVPIYVRSSGETSQGLDALQKKGARPWPNPGDAAAFAETLAAKVELSKEPVEQTKFTFLPQEPPVPLPESQLSIDKHPLTQEAPPVELAASPAEALFAKVRELLQSMLTPRTDAEVAADLNVSKSQAKDWLLRLVDEGVLEKRTKPVCYVACTVKKRPLFDQAEQPIVAETTPRPK
ncbi:DNA-protecting protein DprA [bacterium]|nr:DNA-protecting protein DprA [bacterium]